MKVKSQKYLYFSPTGTTKVIVQAVMRGINQGGAELIDITRPNARKSTLHTSENELLVVAVPVYMGRVPALLNEWLRVIKAYNTPAVCIVVYGNRVYDDALLELSDILNKCGCKTIAGAAFIGEHSFSSPEIPASEGRPDTNDIRSAETFGRKISEKLFSIAPADNIADIKLPGIYPYRGITELWSVDFLAISSACTQCGICVEGCPVGAIDSENSNVIDIEKCITCCACIKNCPQNARTMKDGPVKDAAIRINKLYPERKDPEFFL